jgi:tetratricopeptide (TPR) repeat protein
MAINVPIVSEWEPTGLKKALKDFQKLETTGQKVSYGLEKAFLPATAAVAGLAAAAGLSLQAAVEDEAQQAELARQLQVTTGATEAQIAAVEDYISQTELAAAVSDNELRPAFGNLVRATGDVTEAQELMSLALDVAAGTGKDLEGVTEALQEAIQGEVGPLKELDKSLTEVIESGADTDTVMSQLAETFGGAAAASTETAAGRFELMQIQLQNAREAIGMALLPILEELIPVLESVANFVANNTDTLIVLGTAIGSVSAAIMVANGVMKAWGVITTITKALNLALATSFTALQVATGIIVFTALIAIFVALQKRFDILGKALDGLRLLFAAVKWAAQKMVELVVGGINALIDIANKIPFVNIEKIKTGFDDAAEAGDNFAESMGPVEEAIQAFADAELGLAEAAAEAAYQQQLANLEYDTAQAMMDELHPTVDDVKAAIARTNDAMEDHIKAQEFISAMNTDLITEFDLLFGRFDNTQAVRNFSDAITDLADEMSEFGADSREADEATQDVYRALGNVIDQLDNIPAQKQLELLALLDQGAYDEALRQVQVLASMADTALTTLTAAEIKAAAGMVGGGTFAPPVPQLGPDVTVTGAGASPMNVVVNMPAGSNGEEVARALQKHARKNGTLQIPTTSLVR